MHTKNIFEILHVCELRRVLYARIGRIDGYTGVSSSTRLRRFSFGIFLIFSTAVITRTKSVRQGDAAVHSREDISDNWNFPSRS